MPCLTYHSGWWRDWRGYVWRRLTDASSVHFALGAKEAARGYPTTDAGHVHGGHCGWHQVGAHWVDNDQDYLVFCGHIGQLMVLEDGEWSTFDFYDAFDPDYVPHFTGCYVVDRDDVLLVGYGTGSSPPGGSADKGCIWRWQGGSNLSLIASGLGSGVSNTRTEAKIHGYRGEVVAAVFGNVLYACDAGLPDLFEFSNWQNLGIPSVKYQEEPPLYVYWSFLTDVRVIPNVAIADGAIWVSGSSWLFYYYGLRDYIVANYFPPGPPPWNQWNVPWGGTSDNAAGLKLIPCPDIEEDWPAVGTVWVKDGHYTTVRNHGVSKLAINGVSGGTFTRKVGIHWGEDGDIAVARNGPPGTTALPRFVTCSVHRTGISSCSNCGRLYESYDLGENFTQITYWAPPDQNMYPGAVVQFEVPLVSNHAPTPDSTGNVSRPTVQADVTDEDGIAVDSDSVVLRVDRGLGDGWEVAFEDGAAAEGWVGSLTAISGGYRVAATPDESLPRNSTIKALAYAENEIGNHTLEDESKSYPGMNPAVYGFVPGSGYWEFETADYPFLQNQDPPDGGWAGGDVVPYFEVVDTDGISESTIVVDVWRGSSWESVWTGSSEQPGYDVVETPVSGGFGSGFGFAVDPDVFWADGTVRFRVYAQDVFGNSATLFYEFTVSSEGPTITPIDPLANAIGVPVDEPLEFTVTGPLPLADPWRVKVHRGGGWELALTVSGGTPTFEPEFTGRRSAVSEIAGGFAVAIDPRSSLPYRQPVHLRFYVSDVAGNPAMVA